MYGQRVEDRLRSGARQTSVLEADDYCQDQLFRYLDISAYVHGRMGGEFSKARYSKFLLRLLPPLMAMKVRKDIRGKWATVDEADETAH